MPGSMKTTASPIALISKGIMVALVLWALVFPANANSTLGSWNGKLLEVFNSFYVVSSSGCSSSSLPSLRSSRPPAGGSWGRRARKPEFSNFSWFSMMFGAGLGVGLMVFRHRRTSGPLGLEPRGRVSGAVEGNSPEALQSAYRFTYLHYGFHAWAIYVVTGLSLAYYAYTRNMPLTIRSALTPLFGRLMNGFPGPCGGRSGRCGDHPWCLGHHRLRRQPVH